MDKVKGAEMKGKKGKIRLFIVRLYDGFDNEWIDVSEAVSQKEAEKIWNGKTNNGTKNYCYGDIDYYAIFPSNTQMLFRPKEIK